jgi:hypothetical protein
MYSLRSIDVMSCAKMMGAIYACLGLIVLPFLLMAGFANLASGQGSIAFLFLAVLAPALYGGMGFVIGALTAWVYNVVARRIGGMQLELRPVVGNSQSNLGLI